MAVRVVTTVQTNLPGAVTHREATRFERDVEGGLSLFGADPHRPVAGYSPGAWASVEVLPEPEPVNAAAANFPEPPPTKVTVVVESHDGTVTTYTAADPEDVDVQISRDALPDGDEDGWRKVKPSPLAHFDVRVVTGDVERHVRPGAKG